MSQLKFSLVLEMYQEKMENLLSMPTLLLPTKRETPVEDI